MAFALDQKHRTQVVTASGLDVLAGIWLLISPWTVGFQLMHTPLTNNVLLGIAITILAAVRFFGAFDLAGLSWINAVLGFWVLISPWALGFAYVHNAMANNVVMGIIVMALSLWSGSATMSSRTRTM